MSVGFPQCLLLEEFGSQVYSAFGHAPFQVGSSITEKTWRDVDIRLILDDEEYARLGLGDPRYPHHNAKWVSLCLAYSALGKEITGLPIDFQIQQRTLANEKYKGRRSAVGIVPLRIVYNFHQEAVRAVEDFKEEMENQVIPEMIESQRNRERLAAEARMGMLQRDLCPGCGTDFAEFPEMRHTSEECPGPDCTCYEIIGGHQMGCAFYASK